jgi:hypothetical protein
MLQRILSSTRNYDDRKAAALAAMDDRVDKKHQAIKLYLAKLTTRDLTADEALRCQELMGACVKLEQVGDIVVRNMLVHVRKKGTRKLEFTPEGWASCATSMRLSWPMRGWPSTFWCRATSNPPASWCAKRTGCAIWKSRPIPATSSGCAKARPRASRQAPSTSTRSAT